MNISYNWLQSILQMEESPEEIAKLLTQSGLEVSHITPFHFIPKGLILGRIISSQPHPDADRLKKTVVDVGAERPLSIVCGAPNALTGHHVVVAPAGTMLTLSDKKPFQIEKITIRGEISEGMLCAEHEIGIGEVAHEIITLDTQFPPGTPLEEVWKVPSDFIFNIDLTPNRNDATSHLGVARDLSALLDKSLDRHLVTPSIPTDNLPLQILFKEKQGCLRYTGVVITDIQLKHSPIWMQNRLRSIGVRPLNNIVDITNFMAHEMGQPMHAFDYDKISKKQLILKQLPEGTPFTALDGTRYILNGEELMICDTQGPLCMAGILGGERGKITEATTRIFLESAYFDPLCIYKAAKHHNLHTVASFHFARGTDPYMPYVALQKAAAMVQKYANGTISSALKDHYPSKIEPVTILITYAYITRIIGDDIPIATIHRILNRLEIAVQKKTESGFTAVVPPYRRDVVRPIDLVEEILRIYGLNALTKTNRLVNTIGSTAVESKRTAKLDLKKRLAAQGYQEIITNSLTKSSYDPHGKEQRVLLKNPANQIHDSLRHTLLFSGLEVIQHNLNRKQNIVRCFEVGRVYSRTEKTFQEIQRLGLWIAGEKFSPSWASLETQAHFRDLYATVQNLLGFYRMAIDTPLQQAHPYFTMALKLQSQAALLGYLGPVSPAILAKFHIDQPVFFAEFDLLPFLQPQTLRPYLPIPKHPSVTRDISLAVPQTVTFAQLQQTITEAKIPTLKAFHLVDYYEGEALGAGQKSYTIRLTLQSLAKTLSDKEVNHIVLQLTDRLATQQHTTLRG